MLDCWHDDPRRRPTFEQIVASLEIMMTRDTPYFDFNQLDETHSYYNIASSLSWTNEMKDKLAETLQPMVKIDAPTGQCKGWIINCKLAAFDNSAPVTPVIWIIFHFDATFWPSYRYDYHVSDSKS